MSLLKSSLILVAFSLLTLASCKKDEVDIPLPNDPGVLVTCEGAFGQNNASVSHFDIEANMATSQAFESTNGTNPGDVLQSISEHNGEYYFVVNNSAKIEVTATDLMATSPITGLSSPRYLVATGNKGYVSNLYTNDIHILDLEQKTITGSINVGGWSEEMCLAGDMLYVTQNSGEHIIVVDTSLDEVLDSVNVGMNPSDILVDANGDLWALGYAVDGSWNITTARLVKIDPATLEVEQSHEVPQPWNYSMALRADGAGDDLYVMSEVIHHLSVSDGNFAAEPLIASQAGAYGLGVHPQSGDIYVGIAPDFSSNGSVKRFDDSGNLLGEFQVGIAPNSFLFD